MKEMDRCAQEHTCDYEDTTVADIQESIETNMWLANAYFARNADGLARECLRAAWQEFCRFVSPLEVYSGANLGERLRTMMSERCGDMLNDLVADPRGEGRRGRDRTAALRA